MFTLNWDIEGIHEGSYDKGHVFRTFNNRIFIILHTYGILNRGRFLLSKKNEGKLRLQSGIKFSVPSKHKQSQTVL